MVFVNSQQIEHEVMAIMIRSIEAGASTQTELMSEANLSRDQVHVYVECMQENGLLTRVEQQPDRLHPPPSSSSSYELTEKGLHFLRMYDEMNELLRL